MKETQIRLTVKIVGLEPLTSVWAACEFESVREYVEETASAIADGGAIHFDTMDGKHHIIGPTLVGRGHVEIEWRQVEAADEGKCIPVSKIEDCSIPEDV